MTATPVGREKARISSSSVLTVSSGNVQKTTRRIVLKLDVKGFFMHINKRILFVELQAFIEQKYVSIDKDLLLELCQKIIFYDPTLHCIIKSKRSAWQGCPLIKACFILHPSAA
jgi:hypothetical protein